MWKFVRLLPALAFAAVLQSQANAQAPVGNPADESGKGQPKDYSNSSLVTRMMAFDKNHDGKLTRDEVTDVRLHRLFDHADGNKDGLVTREELIVLAAKLEAEIAEGGGPGARGRGGPRGEGPFGLPGGGPGGFGGPPPPGQVLNPFLQERLNMTPEQKKQLEELQKEVDERLGKILTEEQKKQLKDMREGGRGRFGGPWGRPPPRDQGGRENRRA